MTNWANPGPGAARTDASTHALAYIRAMLAEGGHTVHGPDWWADRGIRLGRLPDGTQVAHCSTCYQAARRGAVSERDAQDQAWSAHGMSSFVQEAALEHWEEVHAVTA